MFVLSSCVDDREREQFDCSKGHFFEKFSNFTEPEEETKALCISTINFLKKKDVVIYGAGTAGEHFYDVLNNKGISPICYLDKSASKIQSLKGIPVFDPDRITALKNDNWVVIVAVNGIQTSLEIFSYLQKSKPSIPIFNGLHLMRVLNFNECINKHKNKEFFNILKCAKCGIDVKKCCLFTSFLKRESKYNFSETGGSKKFDWCGYILGQICTLKCECCCESIPHIKNRAFVKAIVAISDISKLADACEYLERLEFIGGEPFLHPELALIIEAALLMKKVGYIYIFTNGSVLPNDELCHVLKNPRIIVHISNYSSEWPENTPNMVEDVKIRFDVNGIKYIFLENSNWLDISKFEANGLSSSVLRKEFSKCFINHCHRLYNGILYRCPHQFAGIQMNKLKLIPGQYVNIQSLTSKDLADALDDFEDIKFLNSCGYCSMPVGPLQVPAGRQVTRAKQESIDEQKR